jgi:hypothetical protein
VPPYNFTPWFTAAVATLNATMTAPTPVIAAGTKPVTSGNTGVGTHAVVPPFAAINTGQGGAVAADILADITNKANKYHPTVFVLDIGINDVGLGTNISTFRTTLDSTWASVVAANPGVKCWGMSLFANGELWSAGPAWANTNDATIALFNVQIQASAEAHGCTYVEMRDELLALEVVNNAPAPGVSQGVYTVPDLSGAGLHPNNTLGGPFMSARWLNYVTIVPR